MSPSARTPGVGQRVETVEQPAHDTFDRGAREVLARRRGPQPRDRARRVRAGSACARRRSRARARRRPRPAAPPSASASSPAWSTPSQRRDRVGDLRRVERAHERAGSDRSRRRSRRPRPSRRRSAIRSPRTRCPTYRARSRRRPAASPSASAAAMLSPVPGATTASDPNARVVPAGSVGPSTRRSRADQSAPSSTIASRSSRYSSRRRGEVAGARRVAAVGDELAGQLPREPVVRAGTRARRAPRPRARYGAATTAS